MCVTVGGRKTAFIDLQLQKAAVPMDTRLVDNRMNLSETHPLKAHCPICVTVSGIVTHNQ